VTDPLGHTVTTVYDERNKPYLFTDALSNTTKYDFDGNGNTVKLTDELSHVTIYAYDGLDRLEQKTFPDSSYQTWKYDTAGNVTGLRTAAGNTISQTFDTRNRMLTQNYGSTITNTYDLMGRLLTATEGGTSLTYVYDDLGRNTSFTDQAARTSTYTYDLDGNRLNSTYPTSVTVKRAYDASDRLSTLKDGSNNTMATYSYDILDRVTGVSLANSTTVTPGYDLLSRVTSIDNALTSGNRNYSYVYNDANQITSTTEPRGTIATSYDNRNELTGVTEPSGSPFADQSFTFDAGFNRATWVLGSTSTSYTANNLNQYTAVGSATPTWNSDGGLATFSGNSYTYDALGRLTEVDYTAGKTLFSYDPLGRRTQKVDENTSSTILATYQYHYDGGQVAVEYRPSSTTWTYYLGLRIDQPVLRVNGSTKQWYYRDGQGSISAVADNSGDLLESYEYTAQGHCQITNASSTVLTATAIGNDILFTGRNYDPETGNYFYRARYYNPKLGRFISRDPLSGAEFSQGTNLYAYVGNNPTNLTDPTGMKVTHNSNGSTTTTITNPDGSRTTTTVNTDGTSNTITYNQNSTTVTTYDQSGNPTSTLTYSIGGGGSSGEGGGTSPVISAAEGASVLNDAIDFLEALNAEDPFAEVALVAIQSQESAAVLDSAQNLINASGGSGGNGSGGNGSGGSGSGSGSGSGGGGGGGPTSDMPQGQSNQAQSHGFPPP
jgi:RHS repeat-associated protein